MSYSAFRPSVLHNYLHYPYSGFAKEVKNLCISGRLKEAIQKLWRKGPLMVSSDSYASLLQECINLKAFKLGRMVHAHMVVNGFSPDQYLRTKLVILYTKNRDLRTAHQLFIRMEERSLVSWNSMISGYVQISRFEKALELFFNMQLSSLVPDQFTFAPVFRACAQLAMLEQGRRIHAISIKRETKDNLVIATALIDMYCKCSSYEDARLVFDRMHERNVITWTALIVGYGQHGRGGEVFKLFREMVDAGFKPNYITFLAILCACSHRGLVNEGLEYFDLMVQHYKIRPRAEHCSAIVDLLGRAGRVNEAFEFAERLAFLDHSVIWGALLNACKIHGNLELAKVAAKRLFELDPSNAGKYVVLSNAYADNGLWRDVSVVREMMRINRVKKEPGYSLIEVREKVHMFLVGDKSHRDTDTILAVVRELADQLKYAD
ncbi:hypothetical protein AMTRI_Chr10g5550 [Amborella trichopoda]